MGLFRHIACNADGYVDERQHRGPLPVHALDFVIEIAPAENVEDKLMAVTCPHNDIRRTFRTVLKSNTGCSIIPYDHIRRPALVVNLTTELPVEFGYLEDDLLRSSEGHTGVVERLHEARKGNHGVAQHRPPGRVDEEPDGAS